MKLSRKNLCSLNAHIAKHGSSEGFVPEPQPRRRNAESCIQQAVIRWWSGYCKSIGIPEHLLMAIPNGGRRDEVTGALLKKEGARAGATDLLLAVRRGYYGALFIEMKAPDGKVSKEQSEMHRDLTIHGQRAAFCWSYEEAVGVITSYLNGPIPSP